ncbi:hypothetical protein GCM10027275_24750 [Rhabdobacter roseus]|uniref:TP901 family phage tail tape measure protein n=1 Tax=Rhabdobacter roseus TaxID=1655419 RepID=A0A840TNA4_9BACT|nr:phage tail tape measure protein [Rhabdobacter roseus]MBB5284415.1 TP901 family phage tail tape measure protein [Rhabdobacter roseus]
MGNTPQKSVVQLVIDGEAGKASLKELGTALQQVRKELRNMKQAEGQSDADFAKAYAKKAQEVEKVGVAYHHEAERIKEVTSAQSALAKSTVQLIVDGKKAQVSMKDMENAAKQLTKELHNLKQAEGQSDADFAKAYAEKARQVKTVNEELHSSKTRVNDLTAAGKNLKAGWKDVFVGFLGGTAVTYLTDQLMQLGSLVKDKVYAVSDSFADVAKAADMSKQEVKELNSELGKIDTRTLNEDLRKMAESGGRFGVAKEEMQGFVDSADKLNVALGDQFDSVEDLSESVLKMRNIFSDIKSDNIGEDLLHIGNAMNVLEASGAASGKGLADFGSRIGGVAIPLGFTSGQVLGLSATLENLNVTAERGSTAVNTILQKMLNDVEGFAKVAGMSTKEFEQLLNTDLFGAFVKVAQGAKTSGAQATTFAKILSDLKLEGSGASEVMMKIGANGEMLADQVGLATKAIGESNSVLGEFEKKNNNAAAVIDKLKKKADSFLESIALVGMALVESFGKVTGMISGTGEQLEQLSAQMDKVARAESKLPPLLKRFDELKAKTTLTKEEQEELNKVLDAIADLVPAAVTEFDAYGRALDINKEKVRLYTEEQKKLLETMRQSRIETLRTETQMLGGRAAHLQNVLNRGYEDVDLGMGQRGKRNLTDAERQSMRNEQAQIQAQIKAQQGELHDLEMVDRRKRRGYELPSEKPTSGNNKQPKVPGDDTTSTTYTPGSGDDDDDKKADQRRQRQLDAQRQLEADQLDGLERELQIARNKYAKLRDEAKGHSDEIAKINQMEADALVNIRHKYYEKAEEQYDKQQVHAQEKAAQEKEKKAKEEQAKRDKELEEQQKADEALLKAAYGEKTTEIGKQELSGELLGPDAHQAKLDAEEGYLISLFLLRQAYGEDTSDLEQQIAEKDIERAKMRRDAAVQFAQEMQAAEFELADAKREALTEGVSTLKGFFKESSAIHKGLFVFEKAMAISDIIVKTQREIAAIKLAYAAIPGGQAISTPLVVAAKIRAGISIGTIAGQTIQSFMPGREKGGYTDMASLHVSTQPAGYVNRPTLFDLGGRSYIAGEKYKQEYVIPNDMLKDPVMAATVAQMEQWRLSGTKPSQAVAQGAAGTEGGTSTAALESLMMMHIEETRSLRMAMLSGAISTQLNYRTVEETQAYLNHIRQETAM